VTIAVWPLHRKLYLFDPLSSPTSLFPAHLKELLKNAPHFTGWETIDMMADTAHPVQGKDDSHSCGLLAILFTLLFAQLTSEALTPIAPEHPMHASHLQRRLTVITKGGTEAQVQQWLRDYLLNLEPAAPNILRQFFTYQIAEHHTFVNPEGNPTAPLSNPNTDPNLPVPLPNPTRPDAEEPHQPLVAPTGNTAPVPPDSTQSGTRGTPAKRWPDLFSRPRSHIAKQHYIAKLRELRTPAHRAQQVFNGAAIQMVPPELQNGHDTDQYQKMRDAAADGKVVVMQTTMRGKGSALLDDWTKLDSVFNAVQRGHCHFAVLSETKLTSKHIPALHHRYKHVKQLEHVNFRTGYHDDNPSRGVMVIWNSKTTGYGPPTSVQVDGANKRCLILTFPASQGHKLTIASVYMEDNKSNADVQDQFYNTIKAHLPPLPGKPGHNPRHLMIIAGDLNTTMKEGVLDRFSMRTETPAGPGPHLAKFALENELVEAVREMNVEALILTHITSTKEGEATGGAHLSHLLMPPDTWRQCTSAGWTEVNPLFQPADHGIT